jgi:MoaA/NifB/PqqE/SkfB family radical SAM enzyme
MKLPSLLGIGNYFPKLKPARGDRKERPFSTAQIELTSRCSTGCVFCPHDALSDRWVQGDMPVELYREHIAPHLALFDLVYLQGWGEPMLHPDLWEMLELAQVHGCRTGFTTNGSWLQGERNERLLEAGVDMISVSFAGTGAGIHESLRTHSDFKQLCRNFRDLADLKIKRGCEKPWLELHFLMTRANLDEFPGLVELASSLGADEVVATNLAYSPSLALDGMGVFGEHPLQKDLDIISHARGAAERADLPLRVYPLQAEPNTLVCDADPMHSIYINHKGEVSACVYLGLTVQGRIPRYYRRELRPFDPVSFGNVCEGLDLVLQGKERKEFVEQFKGRNVSSSPLAMFTYMAGQEVPDLPLPPQPCRCCYKMMGI